MRRRFRKQYNAPASIQALKASFVLGGSIVIILAGGAPIVLVFLLIGVILAMLVIFGLLVKPSVSYHIHQRQLSQERANAHSAEKPLNPWLVSYIIQYRQTRTRYDIDKQLIESGYDPTEIERAWEATTPLAS